MPVHANGKMQIGNMLLDGEIEVEEKVELPSEPLDVITLLRQMLSKFSVDMELGFSSDTVVEGSLAEPITDPARLLEEQL